MGSHKNISITPTDLTFYFSICHNSKNMEFFNSIPSHMDYDGQQKAETWSRRIVVLFGLVGLAWGYWIQQFSQTVYILGAGLAFAAMLTVPPWPMYRQKPLTWQKPRPENDSGESKSKKKKS